MLFNSYPFLFLVIGTLLVYYAPLVRVFQIQILIISSFIFYAYGQPYLLLLLICSASITTLCSYKVSTLKHKSARLNWAIGGVIVNLLVLAFFKYNNLLAEAVYSDLAAVEGIGATLLMLPLPIGISFYTFQGISLIVDIMRFGELRAEGRVEASHSFGKHFKNTLFYIVFFPQLVAGPIVKAHEFYPQISSKQFSNINWSGAFKAIVLGFFLKMVVADNLKDQTFWIAYPYFLGHSSIDLVVVLFGYSMQIFADFAGYSSIAIGVAALFGYRLPRNFNYPYISKSFSEFWRRWHISLSTWLRDYLYFPLGGNRISPVRTYINLMIVMFLGGLWHGAAWSYAVWGLWHGVALAVERPLLNSAFYKSHSLLIQGVRMFLVFVYVSFAWLLFKLPVFEHVIEYLMALKNNNNIATGSGPILIIIIFSAPVILMHFAYLLKDRLAGVFLKCEAVAYGVMFMMILLNSGGSGEFIYFQF